jgi:hypothetical protein
VRLHLPAQVGTRHRQHYAQHGAGGLLVQTVLRRRRQGAECPFQEGGADPLGPAHRPERFRRPEAAPDHFGEQAEPDRDDLAVLGEFGHRLVEEVRLLRRRFALGQGPKRPAEGRQHLAGVPGVEQVHRGGVLALQQQDFQLAHEARDRHPEVVANQDQGLDVPAVALAQGPDQVAVVLAAGGVQPLLELVEDEDDLPSRRQPLPAAQPGQAVGQG